MSQGGLSKGDNATHFMSLARANVLLQWGQVCGFGELEDELASGEGSRPEGVVAENLKGGVCLETLVGGSEGDRSSAWKGVGGVVQESLSLFGFSGRLWIHRITFSWKNCCS